MISWIKERRRSLFVQIFVSFLALILLFGGVYTAIYHMFKGTLQEEIIQSNQSDLHDAAGRFTNQLQRLQVLLYDLYNQEDLIGFNSQLHSAESQNVDYLKARSVILQMRRDVYNPLFYLEDVIIYFDEKDFALSKSGSSSASYLFSHLYASSAYPQHFWQAASGPSDPQTFRLLPASPFHVNVTVPDAKQLLPYVYQPPAGRYQVIALIDIEKAASSFFGNTQNRTVGIMDPEGNLLYQHGKISMDTLPEFKPGQLQMLFDDTYYFKTSSDQGLTYITAVPYKHVSSQFSRVTGTVLVIFMLTLAVSVGVSILLSRKLHTPVKRMLSAMLDHKPFDAAPAPLRKGAMEYDLIAERIHELQRDKNEIRAKLQQQRSVLTSYSYISRLKNINTDINEWKDFLTADERYVVVLYHIRFRLSHTADLPVHADTAVRHLLDHIHILTTGQFEGSHTFQLEKNEIISIMKGASSSSTYPFLEEIRSMLEAEKDQILVSIAVSGDIHQVSEFSRAYHELRSWTAQAKLVEETQLITGSRSLPASVSLSPAQEREFTASLQSGQDVRCLQLIDQALDFMLRKEAGIGQFRFFADSIASRVIYFVEAAQVEPTKIQSLKQWTRGLQDCQCVTDYRQVFRQLLEAACSLLRSKWDAREEPLISKLLKVMQTQYAEDLSLDYLSAKFNLTSTYLSAYIKDKTGLNFSDHMQGIRMEKARELLACTSLTVNEISQQVGYLNITSFNRTFKKVTGITPGAYRKRHWLQSTSQSG
ncbi:helix-turn-helix domain-containing protein [Paenibacillus cineris]|nr:helix-turn-helix domain-containing protein [Paenibacillus cineris]